MRLQLLADRAPASARALTWALTIYRARLSGRGPLRRVRCTFEHTETCGAYGLRVSRNLAVRASVALIARRIGRCGALSLYRDRERDAWLWHEQHEALDAEALDADLERSRELGSTRAAVLRANALVGRELGDARRVAACRQRLAALPVTRAPGAPAEQLLVRDARGWFRKASRRRRARLALALLCALIAGACAGSWLQAQVAIAVSLLTGGALAWRASRSHARDRASPRAAGQRRLHAPRASLTAMPTPPRPLGWALAGGVC